MVAGRTLLAIFGGYTLAAVATAFLSVTLPLDRSEAVAAATLASFAIMAAAVIWVFSARSLGQAVIGLGIPALFLGAGLWLALGSTVQPA